MRSPPDNGRGRGRNPGHRPVVVPTTTDRQRLARERVQAIDRRRRIGRMADQLMPMAVWYRQPKGCFYCTVVEGWAA